MKQWVENLVSVKLFYANFNYIEFSDNFDIDTIFLILNYLCARAVLVLM